MASTTINKSFNQQAYRLVRRIPRGKVVTYGQIVKQFKILNLKFKIDARVVGWILHANRDLDVPCHRVVDRNGRIAPNFVFGGAREQRKKLLAEGVKFKDKMHVDLKSCLWSDDGQY